MNTTNNNEAWTIPTPATFDELIETIHPGEAVDAVAHMLRILGRAEDWNADTIDALVNAILNAKPPTLPSICNQDPQALAYWTNLT